MLGWVPFFSLLLVLFGFYSESIQGKQPDETSRGVKISIENKRHAYYRGETIAFVILVQNQTTRSIENLSLQVNFGAIFKQDFFLSIPPFEQTYFSYQVETSLLRSQDYLLKVSGDKGTQLAEVVFPVTVARRPNPQRLPVVLWGSSANWMDWGLSHGFNTFSFGALRSSTDLEGPALNQLHQLFDNAVRKGAYMGINFQTLAGADYEDIPGIFTIGPNGRSHRQRYVVAYHPLVKKKSEDLTRRAMELFGDHPAFFHSLINSEYDAPIAYTTAFKERMQAALGFNFEKLSKNPLRPVLEEKEAVSLFSSDVLNPGDQTKGIIEDSNLHYKFYKWWWTEGRGDVQITKLIADRIRERRPDIITWRDPFRSAPFYGQFSGLSAIGHWAYTFPDPKYTLFVETLATAAKPANQLIIPDITTWAYAGWLAPQKLGDVTIPYQIFRETAWLNFSRKPDLLCHYIASIHGPGKHVDTWRRDPRLFQEMARMSEQVYKPYGPAVRLMNRLPRRIALLSSATSALFSKRETSYFGNTLQQIYDYYAVFQLAHLPADIIFEETIQDGVLENYSILILPQCETLPRSIYEKILKFQQRGGLVFADQFLRANIPLTGTLNFDFDHRRSQDVDRTKSERRRVTADEDREIMLRYAKELRRVLDGKIQRLADADAPEMLLEPLSYGDAFYLFAVNDKRIYDERFGEWKAMHTSGESLSSQVRIHLPQGMPKLYDLMAKQEIPYERDGENLVFPLTLGPCEGTIIAVLPSAITSVHISMPPQLNAGRKNGIQIAIRDESSLPMIGVVPIQIEIQDANNMSSEYSDYYVANNGSLLFDFVPAVNDAKGLWTIVVTELISHKKIRTQFELN